MTLKRGPKPAAVGTCMRCWIETVQRVKGCLDEKTREWLAGLSVEQKQEHYILEALKIFPGGWVTIVDFVGLIRFDYVRGEAAAVADGL